MKAPQFLYVAAFAGGTVKVGRSSKPHKRIGAHEDRLVVAGLELLGKHVVACNGCIVQAEAHLIARCAAIASTQRHNEWFTGITFSQACVLVDEASRLALDPVAAVCCEPEVQAAIDYFQGVAGLAKALNVSWQTVYDWKRAKKCPMSLERAIQIEMLTNGAIRCDLLLPARADIINYLRYGRTQATA